MEQLVNHVIGCRIEAGPCRNLATAPLFARNPR